MVIFMNDEIFRITKDKERARDLIVMAKERIDMINILPQDKPYRLIEEYYEILKELLTAIMYIDGYKTLSHKKLIQYFSDNYNELDNSQINLVDSMRKFRNDILYYGKKISGNFLINNENSISEIIKVLTEVADRKIKGN